MSSGIDSKENWITMLAKDAEKNEFQVTRAYTIKIPLSRLDSQQQTL